MTMHERFTSLSRQALQLRISGVPELDDQQGIWKLINPDEIGVHLTEGMMMDPKPA